MPALPVISGATCVRVLGRVGYGVVRQRGSHVRLGGDERPPVTVPLHDELDRGTLRSIIRMTGITVEEFVNLIDGRAAGTARDGL